MTLTDLKLIRCRSRLRQAELLDVVEKYELAKYYMRQKPIVTTIKAGNMCTRGNYLRLKVDGTVQNITLIVSYDKLTTAFYQHYKGYPKSLDAVPFDSLVYVIKGWR